jgi:hypothetical protein
LRTDLQSQPVAVLDGPALEETVCSLNRHASQRGAVLGMTRLEAEGISGLQLLSRSAEVETAAYAVLLECTAKFSPRIEEASDWRALAHGEARHTEPGQPVRAATSRPALD